MGRQVNYTERHPGVALPTLPGLVHGTVGAEPFEIQCDECLVVRSGATKSGGAQIILTDITFNPRRYHHDQRRLCDDCRTIHWKDYR